MPQPLLIHSDKAHLNAGRLLYRKNLGHPIGHDPNLFRR